MYIEILRDIQRKREIIMWLWNLGRRGWKKCGLIGEEVELFVIYNFF